MGLCKLFYKNEEGSPSLEYALIGSFFFFIIVGALQVVLYLVLQNVLIESVRDAAYLKSFHQRDQFEQDLRQIIKSHGGGFIDASKVKIEVKKSDKVNFSSSSEPFDDRNENGTWNPGEFYVDLNGNHQWDAEGLPQKVYLVKLSYNWNTYIPFVGRNGIVTLESQSLVAPG